MFLNRSWEYYNDDRNCSIQKKHEREGEKRERERERERDREREKEREKRERERERERGRERGGRERGRGREREGERDLHQATVKTNNFGMHARQVQSSPAKAPQSSQAQQG